MAVILRCPRRAVNGPGAGGRVARLTRRRRAEAPRRAARSRAAAPAAGARGSRRRSWRGSSRAARGGSRARAFASAGSRKDIQRPLNGDSTSGSSPAARAASWLTSTSRGAAPSAAARAVEQLAQRGRLVLGQVVGAAEARGVPEQAQDRRHHGPRVDVARLVRAAPGEQQRAAVEEAPQVALDPPEVVALAAHHRDAQPRGREAPLLEGAGERVLERALLHPVVPLAAVEGVRGRLQAAARRSRSRGPGAGSPRAPGTPGRC